MGANVVTVGSALVVSYVQSSSVGSYCLGPSISIYASTLLGSGAVSCRNLPLLVLGGIVEILGLMSTLDWFLTANLYSIISLRFIPDSIL